MTRYFTIAGFALALAATPALSQSEGTYDVDDDGSVTMDEFNAGFDSSGEYDKWDADGDGMLSREEFNAGVYSKYDSDGDGSWTTDEFSTMGNDSIWSGMEKSK